MFRPRRSTWLAVFAATLVLAVTQVADAQRDEGRRGRGGPEGRRFGGFGSPTLRLAMNETVQAAIKLSDEQKSKIEALGDQFRGESRKLLDDGGDRETMQKLSEDTSAKLAEVLDDEQQKRLRGISIQWMGAGAILLDPALAEELKITDEQKGKLRDTFEANRRSRGEAFRELRDLPAEERRAKAEKMRAAAVKKLLDVLTPEQQEQLNALQGEKVDIDMSQLWGRGGFEGRGDRGRPERGRRERGERNRNRDDADSDRDTST